MSEDGPWSSDNVAYSYANRLGLSLLQPNATAAPKLGTEWNQPQRWWQRAWKQWQDIKELLRGTGS